MRILKLGLVGGIALTLAACPDQDRDVAIDGDPAMAPREQPAAPPPAVAERVALEEVQGSGVTGEVHVTPRDNEVNVRLVVQNGPPNESLGSRVHSGTCESPGPELARLDAVSTNDMGMGDSETNVGHAPHLIMDGNHIVAVHAPGADVERDVPIACATIPSHGAATPPGQTGTGSY